MREELVSAVSRSGRTRLVCAVFGWVLLWPAVLIDAHAEAGNEPLPLAWFADLPEIEGVVISPSGDWIALNVNRSGTSAIVVHGAGDRVVDIPHGWRMRDALEGAGARYRYIEQEGGDHYLSRQSHRTAFFEQLEAFLAEHLRATGNPSAEGLSD
jgi:acetyl esterase/lipase